MKEMEIDTILGGKREDVERNLNIPDEERHDTCWFCKKIEFGAVPHPVYKEFGYVICKDCLEKHEREIKKISKDRCPDLKIQPTIGQMLGEDVPWADDPMLNRIPKGPGGSLDWFSEQPVIYVNGTETNEESVIKIINHEWIHWVLFCNLESWLIGTQFDNIDEVVLS